MDYKKEMNENKLNYFEFYSKRMKELEQAVGIPEELSKELENKRTFGYEKYGEYSFQANFENTVISPSEEHLREELIDALNYALHSSYKSMLLLQGTPQQLEYIRKILELYELSKEVFKAPE